MASSPCAKAIGLRTELKSGLATIAYPSRWHGKSEACLSAASRP
jgi:hypothetical protein